MQSHFVYLPLNLNSEVARDILKVSRVTSKPIDVIVCDVLKKHFEDNPIQINIDVKKLKKVEEIDISVRKEVGKKLAYLRQANYLSQKALGKLIELDQKTISNIEAGKRRIDILEIVGFSRIFGVGVDYFFDSI